MSQAEQAELQGVAIIGMAGRFPGANDTAQFWQNLVQGIESITQLKDEELEAEQELADRPDYVKARPLLDGIDMFDAAFWGMYPKEAEQTDPQQRILMEVAWQALEDAGYDPHTYPRSIGIFAGGASNGYLTRNLARDPDLAEDALLIGNNSDFLVTKISHKLNLRGPAYTVQCACSTTLVAVCQACQTLLTYQADMVLGGGVAISLPQRRGYQYIPGGMASPDGHCRPFDAKAQGTLFGAGAGLVLLKRLEDALEDGDHIYAVIRGFAVNNDGAGKVGYAAPSVAGQAEAITMAHALAGIPPETIAYHEAHGTGTPLGDPIEIAAATKAFRAATAAKRFCALGSAKANIGHLDMAAGIAGLIKATLTLKHAMLPPLLHFEKPNPALDLENSPFYVNTKLTEWKRGAFPRRASVSSFGVGGTNSHAVLEEAPAQEPTLTKRAHQLLVLSAKTTTALDASAKDLASYLRTHDVNLADVANTLQIGRHGFEHRRALTATSREEAIAKLEAKDFKHGMAKGTRPSVVFMFPGQGAQYCGMGADLYRSEPEYHRWMDECAAVLSPLMPKPLLAVMYPENADDAEAQRLLTSTEFAQPALFASEYALARLWMSWGIEPQAMIGHSVGEFVAACLAGVFSLPDALKLVASRGRMVEEQPRGSMLAVRLPENEIKPLLNGKLSIAAINTPGLCVVSGPDEEVAEFEDTLKSRNVVSRRLHTSHAFHSAMMDPIVGPFTRVVESLARTPPTRRYISTVTGTWVTAKDSADANYWAAHLRQTVRFADGMASLFESGESVMLEVGPGNTLSNLAMQHPGKPAGLTVISSLADAARKTNNVDTALEALGRLWSVGVEPDWAAFHSGERLHRVPLPTYPFERRRYWLDAGARPSIDLQAVATVPGATVPQASDSLRPRLIAMFSELSGMQADDLTPTANFLELGFDSLFLTQVTQEIERRFLVKVTFRQLAQSESSIEKLAAYLQSRVTPAALPVSKLGAVAKLHAVVSPGSAAEISATTVEAVMKDQLRTMMELMSSQLETLGNLGLSPSAVAEFERRMSLPAGSAGALPPASPASPTEVPVTEPQMELILATELGDEVSCAFNESVTATFEGSLDFEAMRYAVEQVTARHDAFRITLSPSRDHLRFTSEFVYELPLVDLSEVPVHEREPRLRQLEDIDARTPFDLVKGPLARFQLVRLDTRRHALIFTAQHIVCDGWSINVIMAELGKLYSAKHATRELHLPTPVSFAAYAQCQHQASGNAQAKQNEKYWLTEFPELPSDLNLPNDRPRQAARSYTGATCRAKIASDAYRQIKDAGAKRGASLFVTLLSGFEVLLSRLSGQNDLVIGIPTAGQSLLPDQELVGHCVHFLPLRSHLSPGMKFSALLNQQKQKMLDAYDHQNFTYGTLVSKLGRRRDFSRLPLTEVRFNLDRVAPNANFDGLRVECQTNAKAFVNFDLVLNVAESEDGLALDCEYSTGLFDESTIARWLDHYQTLLLSFATEVDPTVASLPMLGEAEKRKILFDWNATEKDYPRDLCVHGLIERQCEQSPDVIAAVFEDDRVTYAELERRSNQLARHLMKIGAGPGEVVGIYMERSLEMLVGLLGTLKAGAAYLPLDPAHPRDRIEFIVSEANTPVLLTQSHLAMQFPKSTARIVCLDSDWELIARESDSKVSPMAKPEDLAYVIYTSGSTGKPKGVEVHHRAVVNLLCSMAVKPGMSAQDTLLAVTTLSFDIAALELFLPLIVGAKVVIASRDVAADPVQLMARLESCGATVMQATPVTWRMMFDAGWNGRPLQKILCGGEALPRDLAERLLKLGPELWNMYGPTETTIWSSTGRVERGEGRVPIGPPIANTYFYILTEQNQLAPIGVPGELCIAGDGVGCGYHKRPDLTQERFLADPFRPGERIYRTGDLAQYRSDGTVDFLGRIDHQVKLRGYRIELGEIETVLAGHANVANAVVVVREDAGGEPLLAAYVVPKPGGDPAAAELRTLAARNLPSYMIPSVFVVIESLPLTANGKIDRRSLPTPVTQSEPGKPETSQPVPAARMRKPSSSRNETEAKLIEIWEDILPVRPITPESDFFESGGHSLLAVRMLSRLEKTFGRKMNLATLFQASTIQELAIAIKGGADPAAISGIIPLQPEGSRPPLLCLHGIPSMALLSRELGPNQPFLMVHLPEGVHLDPPYTVEALAEIHVRTIRRFQSHGPYYLVGWCREGLLALEVAQQLEAQGENVELLTIFDAWLPQYMERYSPAETRRAHWLLQIERIRLNLLQINEMGLLKAASFMPDKLWSGMINAIRHLKWRLRNRRQLEPGAQPERRSQDEMLFLAVDHYQAKKYHGRVLLVRSDKYRNWKYWDPRLWWGDFLPRLEMLEIPGIHDSMLTGPSLPRIARAVADAISQSQQSVKQTLTQGRTA